MKQLEATHAMNDTRHEIQSESDSCYKRYRTRANGFQNIRKDSDMSLGHVQRRIESKTGTAHKKRKYICTLGA